MKPVIISFSETMNNERVASQVAKDLNIDWIKLKETKKRSLFTNIIDVLFGRKPKIALDLSLLEPYDFLVFMGPVWIGHPASPFRRIFQYLKTNPKKYGLITVCGGNCDLVSNPKLSECLMKRTGHEPLFVKELKLFDLMPPMDQKELNEKLFKYEMLQEEIDEYVNQAKTFLKDYLEEHI